MSAHTVDWPVLGAPAAAESGTGGLRERKKRQMRRRLSDTATSMFMERGFDAVRVAEIAEACGVSEKTVFNYFPTKEALILDRWDATTASVRAVLARRDLTPVAACLHILSEELGALTGWLDAQDDRAQAVESILRFGALLRSTPALRAHQHDATAELTAVIAELLAERAGLNAGDPEPRIAATALVGLWEVQARSLREHLGADLTPTRIRQAVTADVQRAASVIDGGLGSFTGQPGSE